MDYTNLYNGDKEKITSIHHLADTRNPLTRITFRSNPNVENNKFYIGKLLDTYTSKVKPVFTSLNGLNDFKNVINLQLQDLKVDNYKELNGLEKLENLVLSNIKRKNIIIDNDNLETFHICNSTKKDFNITINSSNLKELVLDINPIFFDFNNLKVPNNKGLIIDILIDDISNFGLSYNLLSMVKFLRKLKKIKICVAVVNDTNYYYSYKNVKEELIENQTFEKGFIKAKINNYVNS